MTPEIATPPDPAVTLGLPARKRTQLIQHYGLVPDRMKDEMHAQLDAHGWETFTACREFIDDLVMAFENAYLATATKNVLPEALAHGLQPAAQLVVMNAPPNAHIRGTIVPAMYEQAIQFFYLNVNRGMGATARIWFDDDSDGGVEASSE